MEAIDNVTLEKHLKRFAVTNNIISVSITLCTALGVAYGFFYDTRNTQRQHTEQISEVEKDVRVISDALVNTEVFKGTNKAEVDALKEQVSDIKKSNDRIETKLDKLIMQTR